MPGLADRLDIPFFLGGTTLILMAAVGLDLVDRCNVLRKMNRERLVRIAELHDVYDAGMIKDHMSSAGINAHLQGYYHRHLLHFVGPYIPIHLMVAERDRRAVQELLERYYPNAGIIR